MIMCWKLLTLLLFSDRLLTTSLSFSFPLLHQSPQSSPFFLLYNSSSHGRMLYIFYLHRLTPHWKIRVWAVFSDICGDLCEEVLRITRLNLPMRFDPGQKRTHGQGLDQSTSPAAGGGRHKEESVRTRKKRESEESWKSRSSLLSQCHTLWPLSVTIRLCWPWASGGWHSPSLSIHLSIHLSLPVLASSHKQERIFSLILSRQSYLSLPTGF